MKIATVVFAVLAFWLFMVAITIRTEIVVTALPGNCYKVSDRNLFHWQIRYTIFCVQGP